MTANPTVRRRAGGVGTLNIGIFGLWGMNIPGVAFGGFETGFSEVARRLVAKGHHVTVYCRRERYVEHLRLPAFEGVNLVYVPSVDNKNLSFLSATTNAVLHALRHERHDVFLFANVGSGFHCFAMRLLGRKVVLNVDGLDWVRAKWGRFARGYFRLAAHAALFACDAVLTDANAMVSYYEEHFGRDLEMIAYGAYIERSQQPELIAQFNVKPMEYYLIASRLVPENNIDVMIQAFKQVVTRKKLLIVGSANYDSPFHTEIHSSGDSRVQFIGWINDQQVLTELYCNAYAYIHGHSVGGTNPALLKALGCGNLILALNTTFNAEVLVGEKYGILWERDAEDLAKKLTIIDQNPTLGAGYREKASDRIGQAYTWGRIANQYELLLQRVAGGHSESAGRMAVTQRLTMVSALALIGAIWLRWRRTITG